MGETRAVLLLLLLVLSAVPRGRAFHPPGAAAYPGGHGRPGHATAAMIWWSRFPVVELRVFSLPAPWRQAHVPCGTAHVGCRLSCRPGLVGKCDVDGP